MGPEEGARRSLFRSLNTMVPAHQPRAWLNQPHLQARDKIRIDEEGEWGGQEGRRSGRYGCWGGDREGEGGQGDRLGSGARSSGAACPQKNHTHRMQNQDGSPRVAHKHVV